MDLKYFRKIVLILFELSTFFIATNHFMEDRNMKRLKKVPIMFVSFIVMIFVSTIDSMSKKLLISITLLTVIIHLLYKGTIITKFSLAFLLVTFMAIVDYVVLLLVQENVDMYASVITRADKMFALLIMSKTITFMIVVMCTKIDKTSFDLDFDKWFRFIIMSLITVIGVLSYLLPEKDLFVPRKFLIPIIFLINNLLVYNILSDLLRLTNENRIRSINEERANNKLYLYKELEKKDQAKRKIMHDYTNTMLCVNGLLKENKINECQNYLERISAKYKEVNSIVITGKSIIDILIDNKYELATSKGIVMVLKLCNLKDVPISDDDLIVILSNLLDNAITAVDELTNSEKIIYVTIKNEDKFIISIINPIERETKVVDNLIKTTKKKSSEHGIGLKNIKDCVNRYNGRIEIDTKKNKFTYLIVI